MKRRIPARSAILVSLTLGAVACRGSTSSPAVPAAPSSGHDMSSVSVAPQRPSTDGVLTIESPEDGKIYQPDGVTLVVDLRGAHLSTTTSTDNVPDEGHLHVILDDQLISMTSGLQQTLPDLAPGQHLLKVEFVANDHAPFDPRVVAAVAFEVKGS
jgi:hypothetical protein